VLSQIDVDQQEPNTTRALNRGAPLSSPFKGSKASTEAKRVNDIELELREPMPLEDLGTVSKTAELQPKFQKRSFPHHQEAYALDQSEEE